MGMDELREIKNEMRGSIDEESFWKSRTISDYFTDIAKAVLNRYGSDFQMKVVIIYDPKGSIAYTTFDSVVLNAACNQVAKIIKRGNKILYLKGLLAHELSHVLYMDKPFNERYMTQLLKGMLLPRIPNCNGSERGLVNAIHDKKKASMVVSISKHLINIEEDGYGENTYLENYYGSLSDGMRYMRKEFYKDLMLGEEVEKLLADEDPSKQWCGVTGVLLVYALYHRLKGDGNYPLSREIIKKTAPILDRTLSCDFKERINLVNELMVALWDYIEKLIEKNEQKDDDNNRGGSNNDIGEDNDGSKNNNDDSQIPDNLEMPDTNKPKHSDGTGMTRPVSNNHNNALPDPFDENDYDDGSNSSEDIEEMVLDELSRKELEKRNLKRMNQEANEGISCGCRIDIFRAPEVSQKMICEYEKYGDAIEVSRKIQKSIRQQLEDRRKGSKKNGLYIGRHLDARQLIKNDGKCFYNNNLPKESPRICVFVIIDESGSMKLAEKNGMARIDAAKTTAVIVEDFCRNLKFPICIIGSTADWKKDGHSELTIYSSFESADNNDRYRLMDISAKSCNRDGAALAYGFDKMKKRPEEIKIMFIISDGKPNAKNYGGIYAVNELKELHEKCGKAGIVTFAAAIGDDKKQIEAIYGDSFLDITDLDSMPKLFVDRIKRFIKS